MMCDALVGWWKWPRSLHRRLGLAPLDLSCRFSESLQLLVGVLETIY